jgi:transposase
LRLNNITDIIDANKYLKNFFIPSYWKKNIVVRPDNSTSEYQPITHRAQLDNVLSVKEYRKIRNDHTFSYGNKFYLLDSPLKNSIAKQEIEIRTTLDGEFSVSFANREFAISEITEPSKPSMLDLEIQRKINAIELAKQIQNVAEAARRSGVSRQTIYRNQKILKKQGSQSLKSTFRKDHYPKNRTAKNRRVIKFSLKNPHLGQAQVSLQMKKMSQVEISLSGVRNVWLKAKMHTTALRIQKATA